MKLHRCCVPPSRMTFLLLSFVVILLLLLLKDDCQYAAMAFVPLYNNNNIKNLRSRYFGRHYQHDTLSMTLSSMDSIVNHEDGTSQQSTLLLSTSTPATTSTTTESTSKDTISTTDDESTNLEKPSSLFHPKPTVWTEFSRLSQLYSVKANLGQGYPDWSPPTFVLESLQQAAVATNTQNHQYTRSAGHPNLVQQLAKRYSTHFGRQSTINPMTEVAITVGASQALYLALQTILQPGQEVILLEPYFDLYVEQIRLAGGIPVYCPLTFVPYNDTTTTTTTTTTNSDVITSGDWVLEPDVFQSYITPLTRVIILNSPHNPTGKLFTYSDLQCISNVMQTMAHPDCVLLSDEVYKYIVHSPPQDPNECRGESPLCPGHIHIASLPGMWNRTLTISSAGKTFSATGWQVGWCIGPSHLIGPIHQRLPYVQFCPSTLLQEALALALPKADLPYKGFSSYYQYLLDMYTQKRTLLASALENAGFAIPNVDRTPGGGFFLMARISPTMVQQIPADRINIPNPAAPGGIARQDWALCQWLLETKGILCIPSSPFFSNPTTTTTTTVDGNDIPQNVLSDQFVRIAFCKTDETIHAAAKALGWEGGT